MVAEQNVTYTDGSVSIPVTGLVFLFAVVIFMFGVLYARWRRARDDHRAIKAGEKPARKAKWSLWRRAFRYGLALFIGGVLMLAWVGRDVNANSDSNKPVPANVVSPTPSKSHR